MRHTKKWRSQLKKQKFFKITKGHAFLGIDFENAKKLIPSSIAKKHKLWALFGSGIGLIFKHEVHFYEKYGKTFAR